METILNDYVGFIKEFENAMISEYALDKNPYRFAGRLFEKKGAIKEFQYQYHGSGCRLERNGVICEYDIGFQPEGKGIKFSQWKFTEFIITNSKYSSLNLSDAEIELGLYDLIEKGKLAWEIVDRVVYKIYEVL